MTCECCGNKDASFQFTAPNGKVSLLCTPCLNSTVQLLTGMGTQGELVVAYLPPDTKDKDAPPTNVFDVPWVREYLDKFKG